MSPQRRRHPERSRSSGGAKDLARVAFVLATHEIPHPDERRRVSGDASVTIQESTAPLFSVTEPAPSEAEGCLCV